MINIEDQHWSTLMISIDRHWRSGLKSNTGHSHVVTLIICIDQHWRSTLINFNDQYWPALMIMEKSHPGQLHPPLHPVTPSCFFIDTTLVQAFNWYNSIASNYVQDVVYDKNLNSVSPTYPWCLWIMIHFFDCQSARTQPVHEFDKYFI